MKIKNSKGNVILYRDLYTHEELIFDDQDEYFSIGCYFYKDSNISLSSKVSMIKSIVQETATGHLIEKVKANSHENLYYVDIKHVSALNDSFGNFICFYASTNVSKGKEEQDNVIKERRITYMKVANAWANRLNERERAFLDALLEESIKSSITK